MCRTCSIRIMNEKGHTPQIIMFEGSEVVAWDWNDGHAGAIREWVVRHTHEPRTNEEKAEADRAKGFYESAYGIKLNVIPYRNLSRRHK